ncbi:MAG TPA: DNA gyrase inhibitor YacG [Candidatus Binatia bacterium]
MSHKVKCPTCRKETVWENNPYRPFCSDRCRIVDLGAWAQERYRIPGEEEIRSDDGEDEETRKRQS